MRAWYEKRDGGRNPPSFDLLVFQLFFVIVTLVIITMVAGASILKKLAVRAIFEIEVEADCLVLGILGWLNAQDGGNVFPLRKFLVRNEALLGFLKGDLGRVGAFATDHGDFGIRAGHHFIVVIDEGELDLAIFHDEEFEMRLDVFD